MSSTHAISLATFLVATSSVAYTTQQQILAEQEFKNIKSFKGQKAASIIPAMQFMSASLKVKCEYCHTQDFASDEKKEKNTAREMIAMQKDINDRNFDGRNQVTCATCHAGHTHPIPFPPTEGVETRTRRSRDVTPAQILTLFMKAVGGRSQPLPPLLWQGFDISGGGKIKTEAVYDGSKYYFATHDPKGPIKFGSDGTTVWYSASGVTRQLPPQVALQFMNQTRIIVDPSYLPKLENSSAGTSKIGTRDMLVWSGTIEGSNVRTSVFFDKMTGLVARTAFFYPTILGSMAEINDFSDYRKVDGFELPTTIATHSGNEDSVKHFNVIHPNPKIDPKIFEVPMK
jgi:hypothetical protein